MDRKGLLLVNSFLTGTKYSDLYLFFKNAAEKCGVALEVMSSAEVCLPCGERHTEGYDFVISWDKDLFLTSAFEASGVRVFNSSAAIANCDDKALSAECFVKAGVPTPKTLIAPKTFSNIGYTDLSFLDRAEDSFSYPFVIKHRFGSFGAQVYLAKDREEAETILRSAGGNEVILQEFIAESAGKDVRINVVGGEICGCMLRYNDHDFRSNITNGGQMAKFDPPDGFLQIALDAARAVGADFAGVDVLFGRNGPIVCEINGSPHFKTTYLSTGVNVAERIMEYVCEKVYL